MIVDLTTRTEGGPDLYIDSTFNGTDYEPSVGADAEWMPPERRLGGNMIVPSVDGVSAISVKSDGSDDALVVAAETGSVYGLPAGQAGPSASNQWAVRINGFEIISYSEANTIDATATDTHDVLASLADWDAFSLADSSAGVLDPASIQRLPVAGGPTGWCSDLIPFETTGPKVGRVWIIGVGERDDNLHGVLRAKKRTSGSATPPARMTGTDWGTGASPSSTDLALPVASGLLDADGNTVTPRVTGITGYQDGASTTIRVIAARNGARAGITGTAAIPPIIWTDIALADLGGGTHDGAWYTATKTGGGSLPDDAHKPRIGHCSITTVGDPNRTPATPTGALAVYVYLRASGLWYSTNGGQTFQQLDSTYFPAIWQYETTTNPIQGFLAADHERDIVYCSANDEIWRISNASDTNPANHGYQKLATIHGAGPVAVEPGSGRLFVVRLSSSVAPANVFRFSEPYSATLTTAKAKELIGDTTLVRRDLLATSAVVDSVAGGKERLIVTSQGDGLAELVGDIP